MEIIHQYTFNTRAGSKLIPKLVEIGAKFKLGEIITVLIIAESDKSFRDVAEVFRGQDVAHSAGSKFTKTEEKAAPFLLMRSTWLNGYPIPTEEFGYKRVTYNLDNYCGKCGVGKLQTAPFRIKQEPQWGKRHLMQLNWVFDVFFLQPEVFQLVFAPFACSTLPVLDAKGQKELKSIVQLIPQDVITPALDLKSQPDNLCSECGSQKYNPHRLGYFPAFSRKVEGDCFRINEWYGSGAEARREVVISQALYRKINEHSLKGVYFVPQAAN